MSKVDKAYILQQLKTTFKDDSQVDKIVVFGSFNNTDTPNDLDLAVFCNSPDDYLTLALSLRKKLRHLSKIIPVDVIPIATPYNQLSPFMCEINKGKVVYERGN